MATRRTPEERMRAGAIDQASAYMEMAKDQLKAGNFTEGRDYVQKALTVINELPGNLFDNEDHPDRDDDDDDSPAPAVGVGT